MQSSANSLNAVCDRRSLLKLAGGALFGNAVVQLGVVGSVAATAMLVEALPIYAQQPGEKKEIEKKRSAERVNGKTMDEWMRDLKEKDVSTRERAIAALKVYEKEAREVAPAVIKAIGDPDMSLRVNAIITLGFIGMGEKDRQAGIEALKRRLAVDTQGIVRFQAVRALGRLGKDGYDAVPALIRATTDTNCWEIRAAAVTALGFTGFDPNGAGFDLNAFKALMASAGEKECVEVRVQGLLSLIRFGTPANPRDHDALTSVLTRCTKETQPKRVQIWARVGLLRIQPQGQANKQMQKQMQKSTDKEVSGIARYLRDRDVETRVSAARALAAIGPLGKPAVRDLIEALEGNEAEMLTWTCLALSVMEDAAAPAFSALKRLENHPDPAVKEAARTALGKIGNKAAGR